MTTSEKITTELDYKQILTGPILVAIGDLLIVSEEFDDEAADTAQILYNAAKQCGMDVSIHDEQIIRAIKNQRSRDSVLKPKEEQGR